MKSVLEILRSKGSRKKRGGSTGSLRIIYLGEARKGKEREEKRMEGRVLANSILNLLRANWPFLSSCDKRKERKIIEEKVDANLSNWL